MAETKIVKATTKKQDAAHSDEPKVTVKAAVLPQKKQEAKPVTTKVESDAAVRIGRKLPPGKPVVSKEVENRSSRIPAGATIVPKEVSNTSVEEVKAEVKVEKPVRTEVKAEKMEKPEVKAEPKVEKVVEPKAEVKTEPKAEAAERPSVKTEGEKAPRTERSDRPRNNDRGDKNDRGYRNDRDNRQGSSGRENNRQGGYNRDGNRDGNRENRGGYNRDGQNRNDKPNYNRDGQSKDRQGGYNRDNRDNRQGGQGGYNRDNNRQGSYNRDRGQAGYNSYNKDKDADEVRQSKPRQQKSSSGASGLNRLETKHNQKDPKRMHADKERDKFSKLEGGSKQGSGKKNKEKIQQRSLEKATKPKKHSQYKTQVEEVEEDILDEMPAGTVAITVPITVGGFCEQADISINTVIMTLMKMGIMANINQSLDGDTVEVLAAELGISVVIAKVEEDEEEVGIERFEDREEDLKPRAPFVTVMGHVDHGKTSLLDAIRATNVVTGEAGGITQHIGASEVNINGNKIVFLDTPGHEAFTAMRARGAHVTDIAVLVVAADDGVMPQTIESISHAKAAGVPIIVAINKMDKPSANPDRVKQELTEHDILVEDWGGDTIAVPVSAKSGDGIKNLLEMILLQAEVLELKANPNRMAMGSVIEARLDKNKGPVATLLVTNGTLKSGASVVVGNCYGRIRLMTNYKGDTIKKAGPATAVEILGLDDVPEAGDEFNAVQEDKIAREIAENRKQKLREEVLARNASSSLEQLFSQIQEGEVKDLNLIIKGDVAGSIGAIVASLEKLNNENVRVKIVHTGVGTITESDVMLASTTGSIIIGFNVRPTTAVQTYADRENVQLRLYRVIYNIINDIEDAMKGMLDPEYKEEVLGKVEVRDTFKVPNVGVIAGAYVQEGKVIRNAEVRLVRDGIIIHEGKISSLKRYKDDAKEVNQGYECGIGIENYNDLKVGDTIECFHMVEVKAK